MTVRQVGLAGNPKAPASLTYAATIATNSNIADHFRVTLTGNATLAVPSNPEDGHKVLWEITADATTRTLTLATGTTGSFKFGFDITSLPNVVANTTMYIGCIYRSTTARWHVLSVSTGH